MTTTEAAPAAAPTTATAGAEPPTIRTTPSLLVSLVDRRRSIALFERIARHPSDVVQFQPMGRTVWLVTDPALARQILTEPGRSVTKGEGLKLVRWVTGDSILTMTDAALHKRNRRLIQPAFSAKRMAAYADVMIAAAQRCDARWRDSPGEVVEMPEEMARLALDIVGRTLFDDKTEKDAATITESLEHVLKRFGVGFLPGGDRLLASRLPAAARVRDAVASMRGTVSRMVAEHRESGEDRGDVMSSLITARDEGDSLDDAQLNAESLTLLLAGHETTANALAWAWLLLDRNPRVAAALHRELAAVLGDGPAAYDDLERLPYTMAVIAETMRLRPPAWMLERETVAPISIGGYDAPVGTTVLASPWLLHHDPRSWGADAEVFRPERWLSDSGGFDGTAPGQPRGAYVPFGGGTRICIGESFAWAEAVLVLATLARRWAPTTEPGQTIGTWAAVTLRPHPGIRMRLQPA